MAGVMAELRNVVLEKYRGGGASSRGFVRRIDEISLILWEVQHRCTHHEQHGVLSSYEFDVLGLHDSSSSLPFGRYETKMTNFFSSEP